MAEKPHPDYERADARNRWGSKLVHLRPFLEGQAQSAEPGKWVWRILPHGAVVGMKRDEDGLLSVRISRREPPPAGSESKWRDELATFRRQLRLDGWDERPDDGTIGVAATFVCPEGELCECGRRVDTNSTLFSDGKHCSQCLLSMKTGRET